MINQAPLNDWDALPLNWRELIKEQADAAEKLARLQTSRLMELIQKESAALLKNRTL